MTSDKSPKNEPPLRPEASDGRTAEQGAAAESDADRSTDQIAALRAELDQVKDHALRCQAELENYRKRVQRQTEDERRYANLPLLRDLLPVLDNVHRAIEAAEKSPDLGALLEGFRLVAGQLAGVLARHHCVPIQSLHQPFDPHRHEAIAQQPSKEFPANTVLMVTQGGFQLHDRVVRPSQVIVSTNNE
jgi:molecular chaperone GrpE